MNHIKRGQHLSLKPQKKSVILDVYTGHRAFIQLRYLYVSFSEQSCHHDRSLNNLSYMYQGYSLSIREICYVFPEKMAPKRVYTCVAISRH